LSGLTTMLSKFGAARQLYDDVSGALHALRAKDPDALIRSVTRLIDQLSSSGFVHAADALLRAASNAVQVARDHGGSDKVAMAPDQLAAALERANALPNPVLPSKPTPADLAPGKPPAADPTTPSNPYGIGEQPVASQSVTVRESDTLPDLAER